MTKAEIIAAALLGARFRIDGADGTSLDKQRGEDNVPYTLEPSFWYPDAYAYYAHGVVASYDFTELNPKRVTIWSPK